MKEIRNDVKYGVIGGSGLYDLDGIENIEEIKVDTPFGSPSDKIIIGELKGIKIAFLPRHGRGHYIMPSGINFLANIFALKKLGVQKIISISAVGSMKEEIVPGNIVFVDQFFDRTKTRPSSFFGNGLVVHVGFSDPVCPVLMNELYGHATSLDGVKAFKGGTYVCMEGPQFSTKAESSIYRKWGVDVIGMTAIPEAKLAREAEMCYATMALVTDYDCWHPEHEAVTVDMVIKQLLSNADTAKSILAGVIPQLAEKELPACSCSTALEKAIITAPEAMNRKMQHELDILIGKYLRK